MDSKPRIVTAGFPEMWQPVYQKYRAFFDLAATMESIVNEMIHRPMKGRLAQTVCRMMYAAANTKGALLTLVLNGYGHDAMKLARSIFEIELNILWLKKHPEDIDDFLDFNIIQQKQQYDSMDEDQQRQVPAERYARMMKEYAEIFPRFATGKGKNIRPRNEWCRVSLYQRAKDVERLGLYQTFYRDASSLHHADIGGLIAQVDDQMDVELAPTWGCLEESIFCGVGSFLRCLNDFDEIAQLGFKDRLENGPNEDYLKAIHGLAP